MLQPLNILVPNRAVRDRAASPCSFRLIYSKTASRTGENDKKTDAEFGLLYSVHYIHYIILHANLAHPLPNPPRKRSREGGVSAQVESLRPLPGE